jgi:hypothetical protein
MFCDRAIIPFCFKLLQRDSALAQATIKPQMAQGLFGVVLTETHFALQPAPRQSPLHHSKFDVRYSIFEFLGAPPHQSDPSNLSDLSDPFLYHPKHPTPSQRSTPTHFTVQRSLFLVRYSLFDIFPRPSSLVCIPHSVFSLLAPHPSSVVPSRPCCRPNLKLPPRVILSEPQASRRT